MTYSSLLIAPRRISAALYAEERWFCSAEKTLLLTYVSCWFVRLLLTGELRYFWLSWNLLLAFVPLALVWLYRKYWYKCSLWKRLGVAGVWLMFLPNAPYLITDLKHPLGETLFRAGTGNLLAWCVTLPLAILGMWWYLRAVRYFDEELDTLGLEERVRSFLLVGINLATAVGVWMGRDLRLNSWEVFTDPIGVISKTLEYLQDPVKIELVFVTSVVLWGCWRFYHRYRWLGSSLG